jgi:hypothetical protein
MSNEIRCPKVTYPCSDYIMFLTVVGFISGIVGGGRGASVAAIICMEGSKIGGKMGDKMNIKGKFSALNKF